MNRQLFEYHPTIGYKFIKSLKTRVAHEAGGYLLRTNNWGFRCENDFQIGKIPGKKRILFFGDSFTAGDGVSNKFRYTDVLETMLPDTEIYNFGLSGSGTDQQFLMYQEYGKDIECDVIVLSVLVENIRRIKSHYRYYYNDKNEKVIYAKPYYDFKDGAFQLFNTPVPSQPLTMEELPKEEQEKVDTGGRFGFARSVVNALGLKEITQKITKYQPVPEYNESNTPEWQVMREIIKQWKGMAQAKLIVIPLPLYQFVEETSDASNYQSRFAELTTELDIPVIDPLPEMRKYTMDERRNFRHKTDVHPTAEGHKAMAEAIYPELSKILEQ